MGHGLLVGLRLLLCRYSPSAIHALLLHGQLPEETEGERRHKEEGDMTARRAPSCRRRRAFLGLGMPHTWPSMGRGCMHIHAFTDLSSSLRPRRIPAFTWGRGRCLVIDAR